ncbi:MAG: hypothetical protein ACYTF1_06620 [Planctomycetota bacterium]|jgi:hypothetical protein
MKAIIVLVIIVAVVLGVVYFKGGYVSFDPDKQGELARATIKPGMPLAQVLAVAGENPKYKPIIPFQERRGTQVIVTPQVGLPAAFNKNKVNKWLRNGELPHGFVLAYKYSEQVAFDVTFDKAGVVQNIQDAMTVADLLGTRKQR